MEKVRWLHFRRGVSKSELDRILDNYKPDKAEVLSGRGRFNSQTTIYRKEQRHSLKVVYKKATDTYNLYITDRE